MGSHILAKIPETKGCGHHITLFLWFSNFTLGQSKVGLSPARLLCDLSLGAQALRDSAIRQGSPQANQAGRGLQGPWQMGQAPVSRSHTLCKGQASPSVILPLAAILGFSCTSPHLFTLNLAPSLSGCQTEATKLLHICF